LLIQVNGNKDINYVAAAKIDGSEIDAGVLGIGVGESELREFGRR
jgi:hypothetical protein